MSLKLAARSETITIQGNELIIKAMKAGRHLALAKASKDDNTSFPAVAIAECVFFPDGSPAFDNPSDVADLDSANFFELLAHVNRVNAWDSAGVEAVKKN